MNSNKKYFIGAALALAVSIQACQTADKKSSTTKDSVAGDTNMVNGNHVTGAESTESGLDEAGATFLRKAAVGGLMEVEAAKIADKNAGSVKVKEFAAKMLNDHTKANTELKALAQDKKVITPDALPAEDQIHIDAMKKMTGAAFDKHYMEMMVTDHGKTIALFKQGAENRDASLKNWATKTLSVIEEHDALAKKIVSEMK
jgi:putative membrane protein